MDCGITIINMLKTRHSISIFDFENIIKKCIYLKIDDRILEELYFNNDMFESCPIKH